MKIALVFPGITDVGFRSYGDGIDGSWHSHGLCILSSCLKEAGHNVSLIDLRKLTGWEEYKKNILELYPDVICITMMSCDFNPGVRCAELAHQVIPIVKIIVGGPHPSIVPEEVASHKDFDYIIKGEGEIALIDLLLSLKEGRSSPRIIEGKHPDLDKLPYSDRELFGPFEVPISINGFESPFMTFIAGRGCMYNCSFCQPAERKIFGPKVRRRSPEHFVGEIIKCHERYNFKSYLIHDDCLIEDITWVNHFCTLMEKNKINIPFACQGRSDLIYKYPEILKKMKNIGLTAVIVGFESGNDRVLRFMRKGLRVEQHLMAAKILKDLELKIWANYMFGVPTETLDEMVDTIKVIKQIKPDYHSPAIYTPHPGSDMFEYCIQNNLMLSLSHDSFRRNVTEKKIKSQDWHVIEWAVSESVDPKSEIVPYSKDYFSHWGDLTNIADKEEWRIIESSNLKELYFPEPSVQNLINLRKNTWRSTTTDPQFVWELNPLLKSLNLRYLVIDLEVNASSRGQIIWWTKDYSKYQATRHFRVKFGRNRYVFNLRALKTYRNLIGNDLKWDDYEIQRLRLDPVESENVDITLHEFFLAGDNN
ncbi:MAG: cobalamin-dependent protein [Candidatus Methanoperedens sp.]|nr:cobalamin-dependent protein [Candidatus Methanoperedens sp.]